MFALRRSSAVNARGFHTSVLGLAAERSALETSLRDGLKTAMKSKDKAAVTVLKAIIADVTYSVKSSPTPNEQADKETVISVIRKGVDKRAVAAESYAPGTPGDNAENYAQLNNEISLLKSYLPVAPTPEAVQTAIDEIIGGLTAEVRASKGVTGVVIKALWEKLGDARASVDKKDVAKRVTESLK